MKTKYILLFGSAIPVIIMITGFFLESLFPENYYDLKAIGITLAYMYGVWFPIILRDIHLDNYRYPYIKLPTFL